MPLWVGGFSGSDGCLGKEVLEEGEQRLWLFVSAVSGFFQMATLGEIGQCEFAGEVEFWHLFQS